MCTEKKVLINRFARYFVQFKSACCSYTSIVFYSFALYSSFLSSSCHAQISSSLLLSPLFVIVIVVVVVVAVGPKQFYGNYDTICSN